jgi:arylformamidase
MVVELSITMDEQCPVYPGTKKTRYDRVARMADGGQNNITYLSRHLLHTGTHVDAPFHFDKDGRTIEEIPIEDFVYSSPIVLDVPKGRGELIGLRDLEPHMDRIKLADLVIFNTGYYRYQADETRYQDQFPAIDVEVARLLRDELLNVVGIAIDTLSVESVHGTENDFPVHKTLLHHDWSSNRTLLIFENVNIAPLAAMQPRRIWALPVRFAGTEAAPVAMIAEVDYRCI